MRWRSSLAFTLAFVLTFSLSFSASADESKKTAEREKLVKSLSASMGTFVPQGSRVDPASQEADDDPLGKTSLKDLHGEPFTVSVINDEYLLKLFQGLTVQGKIPFGFPEDGCYARAHEMAYQLDRKGISTGKVFAHGEFHVDSDKAAKGRVTWNFHVAPIIVVDSGQSREIWVIDPSLFFEPVTLDSWLAALGKHPKSKISRVYFTSRFIYHHRDRDRRLRAFDDEDLGAARRLMKRYSKSESKRTRQKAPDL